MKTDIRMTSCQLICNNERKVMEIDKPVGYYTEKKQTRCFPVTKLKGLDSTYLFSVILI